MKKDHPNLIVAAGTSMMLMMGVAYVWGVYVTPLISEFGWTKAQASLPFSVFLLSYTVAMIIGGRLQDIHGPRKICTIGAFLFGIGYLLSGFATSLFYLCLVYGVIGGIGTGFAYVTPMATVVKWFPHKKGLMGGIVVFGFGAGAFVLSPLVRKIISVYSWQTSFISLGIFFIIAGLIVSQFLVLPPEGRAITAPGKTIRQPLAEMTPIEALKTPVFWMAWTAWLLALTVGLGLMGHIVSYATEVGIDKMTAAFILSIIAIFNGAGRISIGALSDKIGRTRALSGACFVMAAVMAGFTVVGESVVLLYILGGLFGLCFGTWMILYPLITSELFGTKHLGVNYGLLFSSYGIGGFAGPLLYGKVYDTTGSYGTMFSIAAVMCAVAGFLALGIKIAARKYKTSAANAIRY
ncbi:OFA family MFS transporter [bacterium]|nr:OFA family MFS transporter [Candidatus Omnitrophota bacterium]MBU2528812.1 OFA family MFS transporter [bacterium]MBU3929073.1 OFA family MFS transporter [bacterium]MBU4123526.1 OFA family MFS transporter [bacterium]